MFYHSGLLSKKGPLGTVWIAGHYKSQKLSKKKIMEASITVICDDLAKHMSIFALPVRISLVLGASIILQRKATYLLHDAEELKKQLRNIRLFGRPVEIDLGKKRPDKTSKQLALPLPALDLNLDAVDIRAFLDEVEVDLAVGVAREEQITLPGPPVILGILAREIPLTHQNAFVHKEERNSIIQAGLNPQANVDLQQPITEDFGNLSWIDPVATYAEPSGLVPNAVAGEDHRSKRAKVAEAVPLPVGPEQLGPAAETAIPEPVSVEMLVESAQEHIVAPAPRRNVRRKKLIIDKLTQIPAKLYKSNLENVRFRCRPVEEVILDPKKLRLKSAEKNIVSTGGFIEGSDLLGVWQDSYQGAVGVVIELGMLEDAEDPFGWCDAGVTDHPADVHRDFAEDMVLPPPVDDSRDMVAVSGISHEPPPPEPPSRLSRVRQASMVEGLDEFMPPSKRHRRDMSSQERAEQRAEQFLQAGEFMENRYTMIQERDDIVTFQAIMDGNSRKKVARCFSFMLAKAAEGKLSLAQATPYGAIVMTKSGPLVSLSGY